MKRIAFLQALILFLLLVGSWFLLLHRFGNPGETKPPEATHPPAEQAPPSAASESVSPLPSSMTGETAALPPSPPPPEWQDWFDYLMEASSPMEMRSALNTLWNQLSGLPRESAVQRILHFLDSRADMPTGLALQPGPGLRLRGAASLRAILADWLAALDPPRAAAFGRKALAAEGTRLSPDEYVVHLRNVARVEPLPEARDDLIQWVTTMFSYDPWINAPNAALAEAMDLAVFLAEPQVTSRIATFLRKDQPPLLRRAASLAMERLVDARPVDSLTLLLDEAVLGERSSKIRAGLFARLDPYSPEAKSLLHRYLFAPDRSLEEARFFLDSFPNLNQSRSHNLISHQNSTTSAGAYLQRLERALELVEDWIEEDPGNALHPGLQVTRKRIEKQLSP